MKLTLRLEVDSATAKPPYPYALKKQTLGKKQKQERKQKNPISSHVGPFYHHDVKKVSSTF